MKIRTDYWPKPIPMRGFDWCATWDNYEPGEPIGYGPTEALAIEDLHNNTEALYEIRERKRLDRLDARDAADRADYHAQLKHER